MKCKILFILIVLCSTNLFSKEITVTVSKAIVTPGFHDDGWFCDDELEVEVFLAGCKTNDYGRFECDDYLKLGELNIAENETTNRTLQFPNKKFTFKTEDLTTEQKSDPNLGLYFVADGNIDSYSKTGLLGECIRKLVNDKDVKHACGPIRNGNGVFLELSVSDK